jgi:hypothetical protein
MPGLHHGATKPTDQPVGTGEVDLNRPHKVIRVDAQRALRMHVAGVGNDHVHRPERLLGRLGERIDRCIVGQVERRRGSLAPTDLMAAANSSRRSVRRAPNTTGWPAAANDLAAAAPMPDEAPVTTATRRSGWGTNLGTCSHSSHIETNGGTQHVHHRVTSKVVGRVANPRTFTECTRLAPSASIS